MLAQEGAIETRQNPFSVAVRFEQVTCQMGKRTILDRLSLTMKRGEITGILGPNGAGKTTLLHCILGLRRPSTGTITVFNERLPGQRNTLRQRIGVVFQETALYDELTTVENLRFAASLYHVAHQEHRIEEVLGLLFLSERAHEQVRKLSGGLRRRVALARALLHAPDLFIIDEPTLGVDVEARHALWSHLRLLKARGATIVVSTNYLDEAQALCDTVAVLRAGKLLTSETPQALIERCGSCLDIECTTSAGEAITRALNGTDGVLRITKTPTGCSIFLTGRVVPDAVMRQVLQTASIHGFRSRSPDLAEVFRALEEPLPGRASS
jgi:ABC-2 type transport system ATP-binding protein